MSNHQTFLQIRVKKNLSLEDIAKLAQVSPEDIYYLEAGVLYPKEVIEKALQAISILAKEAYTSENVGGIYMREEEVPTHAQAAANYQGKGA